MNDRRINTGIDFAVDGARILADDAREFANFQKAARPLRGGGVDGSGLHVLPHRHAIAFREALKTRRYMTLETVAAICEDGTMDPAKIAAL